MKLFGWFKKERTVSKLNCLFKQKKYAETIELATTSLAEGINAHEFYTFQIWSWLETKQPEKAKEATIQALATYPDHPVFFVLDGEVSYRLEDYDHARQSLMKAMELSPGNLQVEYLLGLCFVAQGKLEEASEYFDSILRYDPTLLQTRLLAMTEHYIFKHRRL